MRRDNENEIMRIRRNRVCDEIKRIRRDNESEKR